MKKTMTPIKYIHGSEDSIDTDVVYVVDKLPSLQECKKFCSDKEENRNICVINNGIVTECYKGTPDEVNNAVFLTYHLHEQEYPLLITKLVQRDVTAKCMRAVRIILSHLSRSQYRTQVKAALVGDWFTRIKTLKDIDLTTIDFSTLNKNMTTEDVLKTIAFQLGQTILLIDGIECYTKGSVGENLPSLIPFLYRDYGSHVTELERWKNYFIEIIKKTIVSNGQFIINKPTEYCGLTTEYDVKTEKKISESGTMSMWDRFYKFLNFLSTRTNFATVEMDQDLYDFCNNYVQGFIDDFGIIYFNGKKFFLG